MESLQAVLSQPALGADDIRVSFCTLNFNKTFEISSYIWEKERGHWTEN